MIPKQDFNVSKFSLQYKESRSKVKDFVKNVLITCSTS